MSRLQKKCFLVSVGAHLLLPVILLVGTALSPRPKPDPMQLDNFIAAMTVEEALSGGGDNTVKTAPAPVVAPPAPVEPVTPPAPPVVDRTPPPPVVTRNPPPLPTPRDTPKDVKLVKPDVTPVESNTRTHKIDVSTKIVTTSDTDAKAMKAARDTARAAKAAADKRKAADALSHAIASIHGGVSGSTEVKYPGPGGGGVPYANFYSQVYTVYYNAWHQPEGVPEVTVKVSVTIARDGTVINARIVKSSGNSAVDKSVQETIESVKFAAPLPESSTDEERTVPINFNTQAPTTG